MAWTPQQYAARLIAQARESQRIVAGVILDAADPMLRGLQAVTPIRRTQLERSPAPGFMRSQWSFKQTKKGIQLVNSAPYSIYQTQSIKRWIANAADTTETIAAMAAKRLADLRRSAGGSGGR